MECAPGGAACPHLRRGAADAFLRPSHPSQLRTGAPATTHLGSATTHLSLPTSLWVTRKRPFHVPGVQPQGSFGQGRTETGSKCFPQDRLSTGRQKAPESSSDSQPDSACAPLRPVFPTPSRLPSGPLRTGLKIRIQACVPGSAGDAQAQRAGTGSGEFQKADLRHGIWAPPPPASSHAGASEGRNNPGLWPVIAVETRTQGGPDEEWVEAEAMACVQEPSSQM